MASPMELYILALNCGRPGLRVIQTISRQKTTELRMKVLIVHNHYKERGGEDAVVLSESNLLRAHGVEVELCEQTNDSIVTLRSKLAAAISVVYSSQGFSRVQEAIERFEPDVIHVHNWFPTLSPGIFWACKKQMVPVVHTLHNFRLLCANGNLFRNGGVCEDCLGTTLRLPGVIHACYRNSHSGTAMATAGMLTHWQYGTWHKAVDAFIALTKFAKRKLVAGGIPEDKIVVKPNFLEYDPGFRPGDFGYFCFVGRLTEGKGIAKLLECWRENPDLPQLRIIGDGPLAEQVRTASQSLRNLEWQGQKGAREVLKNIGNAKALLCPSLWYEGMPRVVIESLAVGTPVIGPNLGSYAEMIVHDRFGMLFNPSDPQGFLACVRDIQARSSMAAMRLEARKEFELRYTGSANFKMLLDIYESVSLAADRKPQVLQVG